MSEGLARKQPRTKVGVVVSAAPPKTAVVSVRRRFKHPRYHKFIQRDTKYMVHDEHNVCAVGDRVVIVESRPMSKHKHWKLKNVAEKALQDPLSGGIEGEETVASGEAGDGGEA